MQAEVIQPWAAVSAAAWANASKAVVVADMRRCLPPSALTSRLAKGCWKVILYEAEELTGNMVWASGDADVAPLRLPLCVSGWHALFIGLYATNATPSHAWLKLDGETAPTPIASSKGPGYWWMQEVFWKVAELKPDQCLHIQHVPLSDNAAAGCGVAYVKMIPLPAAEIAGFCADRDDAKPRRLATTCDHFSFMAARRPTTVESLLSELEIFRDTDFSTLLLHIGGADQVCYPSRHGTMWGQAQNSFADKGQCWQAESCRELARKGINPTKVLIDGAHALGMKVHIGFRPALWSYHEPFTDFFESPFFGQHPEWRTVDRDGTQVARMSWAVPEVRKHLLDVLGEAVALGADGAHIVFTRGFPVTLYEPSFCALFQARFGEDPRRLEESDPRIATLRADIITTFVRELRTVLNEEAKRRVNGRRLEISMTTLNCEEDNLRYGLDLRRLAREQLIDEVYPAIHKFTFGGVKRVWDMDFFMEACAREGVRVIPMIDFAHVGHPNANYWPYPTFLLKGIECYEKGAAGVGFWDPAVVNANDEAPHEYWKIISRFGHLDELRARLSLKPSKPVFRSIRRLGEHRLDARFPPYWGG